MTHSPMFKLILETPAQLMSAGDIAPPAIAPADHIVLLAMGGSAMAARAVKAAAASSPTVIVVHQDYGLPPWAIARKALVVAVSYSGNTEEVLSGVRAAVEANLPFVAVSAGGRLTEVAAASPAPNLIVPDGLQPRAALGFQVAATMRVLEGAGAIDEPMPALEEAADVVDGLLDGGAGSACTLGADVAAALADRVPVIVGAAGPGSLAAGRWMTQIAENAKRMAFAFEVPEANHNILEPWAAPVDDPGRYGLVTLFDAPGNRRNQERLRLTSRLLGGNTAQAGEVRSKGVGPLARLFSLGVVGDVASVVMSDHSGVDAMPVDVLENFKKALREE